MRCDVYVGSSAECGVQHREGGYVIACSDVRVTCKRGEDVSCVDYDVCGQMKATGRGSGDLESWTLLGRRAFSNAQAHETVVLYGFLSSRGPARSSVSRKRSPLAHTLLYEETPHTTVRLPVPVQYSTAYSRPRCLPLTHNFITDHTLRRGDIERIYLRRPLKPAFVAH